MEACASSARRRRAPNVVSAGTPLAPECAAEFLGRPLEKILYLIRIGSILFSRFAHCCAGPAIAFGIENRCPVGLCLSFKITRIL